jgi:hypothetical protein
MTKLLSPFAVDAFQRDGCPTSACVRQIGVLD